MNRLTDLATGRPRRVMAIAGIVFLLAAALGAPVAGVLKGRSNDFHDPHDQSLQTKAAIQRATGQSPDYGVAALVKSPADVRSDPRAQRLIAHVATLLAKQKGFQRALDYPASHLGQLVSRDGRESVVLAAFATQEESATAVANVRPRLAGSGVRFGGQDVAFDEINRRTSSDLERAELLAFPLLLLLSLWVFRGLVAAMLPLLVGGFAIVLAFVMLRLVDQFAGLSIFAVNLVTGVGLGLGIDYSLFVLSRYREELASGKDSRAAIARTLQTAGRTVLYGSLTVAGALASMLVFPERFLYSMGVGGTAVALMAGAVSLVVLPAVLIVLGPRIDALSPKWMQRGTARAASADEEGGWARLARAVMRRPGTVALLTSVALLAIASPALRLALTPADPRVLPTSSETRQVSGVLTKDFAVDGSQTITMVVGGAAPVQSGTPVAGASATSPASALGAPAPAVQALAAQAQRIAAGQAQVVPPRYLGKGQWEIDLLPQGSGASKPNQTLVKRLRALVNPQGGLVGGPTAGFIDQKSSIAAHVPLVLAILALVTCGFLFLMTGSAVMPLIALAMNLLTVAVGAGLLVLVFQDGHLSSLLGFSPIGGLEEANLVLLFVIAFALSTDYGVFLFGRIKEAHEQGLPKPGDTRLRRESPVQPAREAIARGLERTGRLVTAAALLFCVAIGAFASSHIFFVKQLGVGAALAVAIDATVVRALLVPAIMGRLGEWAWWAPRPLRKLHRRIGLREGPREGSVPAGVLES